MSRDDIKPLEMEELVKILKGKVFDRTPKEERTKQCIYRLFGQPGHGVTLQHFREALKKLGICLASEDVPLLFNYFDKTGSPLFYFSILFWVVHQAEDVSHSTNFVKIWWPKTIRIQNGIWRTQPSQKLWNEWRDTRKRCSKLTFLFCIPHLN